MFVFKRVSGSVFGGVNCRACAWVEDLLTRIKVVLIIKNNRSHFILGGLNYYVLTSKTISTMYLMYCKTLLLLLRWIRVG